MIVYIIAALIAMLVVAGFIFSQVRVVAQPNEWMIVLREGKMIKCGVGISCLKMMNDKVVKFPSKVHKVNFTAQQVTREMQGIEVSGMIIWTIFRDGEGPFKAYKSLGNDIHEAEPKIANQNLVEMANGIVRHKIANSTINEILRNRKLIREDIKKELNKNINGWGVWLETVEITDVKILSGSLFENLQTEFREAQRQKAEIIGMKADNEMKERKLLSNLEFAKKEAENETKKQIIKSNEQLKVNQEKQRIYDLDQELQKEKFEKDQELKKLISEADAKLKDIIDKNNHELFLKDIEYGMIFKQQQDETSKFEKQRELDRAIWENENQALTNANTRKNDENYTEMIRKVEQMIPYDVLALERVKELILTLPLQTVKVFNFSSGIKDASITNALQQIMNEYNVIKSQI